VILTPLVNEAWHASDGLDAPREQQAFLPSLIGTRSVVMGVGAKSGSQAGRMKSIGLLSSMMDNMNSVPNPNQVNTERSAWWNQTTAVLCHCRS
jgi:hypothetical protein